MNGETIAYCCIVLWFVVVITHALTRAACTPTIVNKVIAYKEIVRDLKDTQTFKEEMVIDEREFMRGPRDIITERYLRRAKEKIFYDLPNEVWEIKSVPTWRNPQEEIFSIVLKVIPPLDYNNPIKF